MFAERYFTPRYFAPRYFAELGLAPSLAFLTAPTSADRGVASAAFSLEASAPVPSTMTITPATSGTGVFTPSTVTIASGGTLSTSFTYTGTVSGACNISVTNDLSYTNPSPVAFTVNPVREAVVTISPPLTEADVVAGGRTIQVDLIDETFVATSASDPAKALAYIQGFDAASSPALGWNNVVRDGEIAAAIVRDSNTRMTWTLTAFPTYHPLLTETITATLPASVLTSAVDLAATSPFQVQATSTLFTTLRDSSVGVAVTTSTDWKTGIGFQQTADTLFLKIGSAPTEGNILVNGVPYKAKLLQASVYTPAGVDVAPGYYCATTLNAGQWAWCVSRTLNVPTSDNPIGHSDVT